MYSVDATAMTYVGSLNRVRFPICQFNVSYSNSLFSDIKSAALENSQEWFGKKYTNMEVLDALWTPILKFPKVKGGKGELDYDRPPNLRIKLPIYDGEWKSKLYDTEKNQIFTYCIVLFI